jgi:PTS system nitrogen regulatory IIA component
MKEERSKVADIHRVAGWVQPEHVLLDVEVRDLEQAIATLSAEIARLHGLDAAVVQRALWRREQVGSTAVGEGLAIPHAQIGGIAQPLTLFMRTRRGIADKAPDGKPVCDWVAILVPADGQRDDHLQLLALVARLFSNAAFRRRLADAPDAGAAAEAFRGAIAEVVRAG